MERNEVWTRNLNITRSIILFKPQLSCRNWTFWEKYTQTDWNEDVRGGGQSGHAILVMGEQQYHYEQIRSDPNKHEKKRTFSLFVSSMWSWDQMLKTENAEQQETNWAYRVTHARLLVGCGALRQRGVALRQTRQKNAKNRRVSEVQK